MSTLNSHQKIHAIQGLRALAVISVFAYHLNTPILSAGFLGVDIFFVISGFVITKRALDEIKLSTKFDILRFFARRINRLIPALAVMIVFVLAVACLYFSPVGKSIIVANTGRAAMLSIANLYLAATTGGYFDETSETNPLVHTWSLSVEDQFYFLFAICLFAFVAAFRKKRFIQALLTVVALGGAVSLLLVFVRAIGVVNLPPTHYYSPLNRVWEFSIGICAAIYEARQVRAWKPESNILALLLSATLFAALIFTTKSMPGLTLGTFAACMATGFLILFSDKTFPNRLLSSKIMNWVGDRSYSIYLWHWPVIAIISYTFETSIPTLIAIILTSLALAELSYRFIEKPFIMARVKRSKFWLVPTVFVSILAIVSSSTISVLGSTNPRNPHWDTGDPYKYATSHFYPCVFEEGKFAELRTDCTFSKKSALPNVVLVGDSHAGHLFPGLAEKMPTQNLMSWHSSDVFLSNPKIEKLVAWMNSHPEIKIVIYSAKWDEKLAQFPSQKWADVLSKTADALRGVDRNLILMQDVPGYPFTAAECAAPGLLAQARCTEAKIEPTHNYLAIFKKIRREAPKRTSIFTVDGLFCSGRTCSMKSGEKVLYSDSNHLNLYGSRLIAEHLYKAVN